MSTREHKTLIGTLGDSTTKFASKNKIGSAMMSGKNDHDCEIGNSVGSYYFSSISNEGSVCYSSDTDGDGASLVPKWKDDGDDSVCTSIDSKIDDDIDNDAVGYEFHEVPKTLEFTVGQETMEYEIQQPLDSPTSVSYSQHSSRRLKIDVTNDNLPSLPVHSVPSDSRRETLHSDGKAVLDQLGTDIRTTEQRNNFRRRLQTSTDTGSTDTILMSESQSSSSSPSLSSSESLRRSFFSRSRPRFALVFGAMVIVMLSVHDSIKSTRQYYRQQYQLEQINNRREEIAFPLVQVQVHSDARGTTDGVAPIDHDNTSDRNRHPSNGDLPKFYFPKPDPSNQSSMRGSTSAGRSGSNLAMGRPQQPRPIFVPDTPLPNGGFRKPLERFVFDPQEQRQRNEHRRSERRDLEKDSFSSWTSWLASLTLIGMLFDTGWKEYRRHRIAAIPSSRDE